MRRPPVRIGLTGGIASGKSLVAGMLRDLGAAVVDADQIARDVLAPDGAAYAEVVRAFGPGIVRPDGTIDRKALAARIFADAAARRQLNALTHAHIRRRIAGEAARLEADPGVSVIVLDIPLLLETTDGREFGLAGIIVVYADDDVRLARLTARDGLSAAEAQSRLRAQMPLREKLPGADWVIDNNGSPDETRRHVEQVWNAIRSGLNVGESAPSDPK